MGVVRQTIPWTIQPQILARVNNGLGIVYCCNHAMSTNNGIINNADDSFVTYASFNGDKSGHGPCGVGPKPSGASLATITKSLGSNFSLLAVVSDWTTGLTAQSILDDDDGASRVFQFRIYNDKADFIRFNTAGSAFTASSATLTAAQRNCGVGIVARCEGSDVSIWVDGIKSSTTLTGTPKAANSTFAVLGRKGVTQPILGRVYLSCASTQPWDNELCSELSLNPWQVFAP